MGDPTATASVFDKQRANFIISRPEEAIMKGNFCHIEITVPDGEKAKDFYSVFGWKFQTDETGYTMVDTGAEPGGGIFVPGQGQGPQMGVTVYINTECINCSLEEINAKGGKTIVPRSPIGAEPNNMGWFAVFSDPFGNVLGLYEPNPDWKPG